MSYKKQDDIRVDLTLLHPWLQYKIKKFLKACHKEGLYVMINTGFRTVKEQNDLYAQGRTKKGNIVTQVTGDSLGSQHQWGIAFDFGNSATTTDEIYNYNRMCKIAKIAKEYGLAWGGDWKGFVDTPHLYLPKWGDTPKKLKKKFKTPAKFKKYWKRTIKSGSRIYGSKKLSKKDVKKEIDKPTKVSVLYYKGRYAKVKYGNLVGYVKKSRLTKIK